MGSKVIPSIALLISNQPIINLGLNIFTDTCRFMLTSMNVMIFLFVTHEQISFVHHAFILFMYTGLYKKTTLFSIPVARLHLLFMCIETCLPPNNVCAMPAHSAGVETNLYHYIFLVSRTYVF